MNPAVSLERETDHTPGTSSLANRDNSHPTCSWLDRLAFIHRDKGIRHAMRLAGMRGVEPPSLDVLRDAECPPAARWTSQAALIFARIRGIPIATMTDAEVEVRRQITPAFQPSMINRAEYEAGQHHAARWRPVLEILSAMRDAIEARIPDAWLAATSEDELMEAARVAAWLGASTTHPQDYNTPKGLRASCPYHHKRRLRRRAAAARQHLAALLGTIGKGGAPYADSYAVACWRERQAAAKAFGESHVIDFEGGEFKVGLWEVMETSRKARIASLYAQALGLEDVAREKGLLPVFLTLTLPPEHHPNPRHGHPYAGQDWADAPSPRETDEALAATWQRFRARLAKSEIDLLGFRVVEPHADGCPHLHALLYVEDDLEIDEIDRHLTAICPEPIAGRRIASRLERIDRTKASPASYVMKYILKSLPAFEDAAHHADGQTRDGDPDHLAHHAEVCAWASERRLRRFAWLGLHGMRTVWQRIHGMDEQEAQEAPKAVFDAWTAMQRSMWADAMEHLGAIKREGKERPRLTYQTKKNGYGEDVKRPVGICLDEWTIPLRRRVGTIVRRSAAIPPAVPDEVDNEPQEEAVTVNVSDPRACPATVSTDGGVGRTGPPPQKWTVAHRVGGIEILVPAS